MIVRTAAEGIDGESLQNDLQFLLQLWETTKTLYNRESPGAALPMLPCFTVSSGSFTDRISQLIIDNEQEYIKVQEILDLLSPHLKNKVFCYRGKEPIFERFSIEEEIERSLNRVVWLAAEDIWSDDGGADRN